MDKLLTIVSLLFVVSSAFAGTTVWNAGAVGNRNNPANWSAGVPTLSDKAGIWVPADVTIDSDAFAFDVKLDGPDWANRAKVTQNAGTLSVTASAIWPQNRVAEYILNDGAISSAY